MRYIGQLFAAVIFFLACLFSFSAFVMPSLTDVAWVENLVAFKSWRLSQAGDGPRIIIIGGSEAHFSISAEQIEKETGIATVNFGMHALLGWKGQLDIVEKYVRKGDTIIFSANQYALNSVEPTALKADYMRRNNPTYFLKQPLAEWPGYLGSNIVDRLLRAVPNAPVRLAAAGNGVKLDLNGDEMQFVVKGDKNTFPPVGSHVSPVPYFDRAPDGFFHLAAFVRRWEKQGVKTYVNWMAMRDKPEFATDAAKAKMKRLSAFAKAWKLTELNAPYETVFSDNEIANSPTHGNSLGRTRYTTILINRLKPLLSVPD